MWTRAATILCALGLAACGDAQEPPAPPPATTCPIATAVAAPTFVTHVLPALRQSCGAGNAIACHGGTQGTAPGKVSYDPSREPGDVYASLVNAPPANAPAGYLLVAPGDRANSWLLAKVEGRNGASGFPMPLGEPPLCAATLETLRNWIDRGAPLGP